MSPKSTDSENKANNFFNIKNIAALISTLSIIIGTSFVLDNRWAKAAEVNKLNMRLEQKIIMDRNEKLQERIWKIQDRYQDKSIMPISVIEEIRIIEKDIKENESIIKEQMNQ